MPAKGGGLGWHMGVDDLHVGVHANNGHDVLHDSREGKRRSRARRWRPRARRRTQAEALPRAENPRRLRGVTMPASAHQSLHPHSALPSATRRVFLSKRRGTTERERGATGQ
jgi:hypothetical protein